MLLEIVNIYTYNKCLLNNSFWPTLNRLIIIVCPYYVGDHNSNYNMNYGHQHNEGKQFVIKQWHHCLLVLVACVGIIRMIFQHFLWDIHFVMLLYLKLDNIRCESTNCVGMNSHKLTQLKARRVRGTVILTFDEIFTFLQGWFTYMYVRGPYSNQTKCLATQ
jgi:hypothetical protein